MKRLKIITLLFVIFFILIFLNNSCLIGDSAKFLDCSSFEGQWKSIDFKMKYRGGFIAPEIFEIPHEELTYPFEVDINSCDFSIAKSNGHTISGNVSFTNDSLFLLSDRNEKYNFKVVSFSHDTAVVLSEYLNFCIENGDSTEFVHGRGVNIHLFRYKK